MGNGQLSAETSDNIAKLSALTHFAKFGQKSKQKLHRFNFLNLLLTKLSIFSKEVAELIPASVCEPKSREIDRWAEKVNEKLKTWNPLPKETEAKMEFLGRFQNYWTDRILLQIPIHWYPFLNQIFINALLFLEHWIINKCFYFENLNHIQKKFPEIVIKLPHFGVTNYKLRSAQEDGRELQVICHYLIAL